MLKRNGIVTAVVAMAIVGVAPGGAEAHQVASGSAKCELVANVPTITASASFVSFTDYDKREGINGALKVDGTTVQTVTRWTFSGANGTWNSAPKTVTAGPHRVTGIFSWWTQGSENGSFAADVMCPTPKPPVTPPKPPLTPPTPPLTPPTTPVTPPTTPVTPPTTPVTPSALPAPPAAPAVTPQVAVLGETDSDRCVPKKPIKYQITLVPK